ncbi:tetratricopeptide repeat protein [Solihabitans fulvus]|uniref:Tetratricopeptide repeat protein n=1 Tax=Solihabitans fulvus TaxID=1892852 RepID=A0A5B2XK16_9PSEU|nr:tetratricopeptide repeat protein [Solihabitans fulvus]KAA2264208.1 tetratricopeptide repeat protein [Solihabitans fulvus]
MGFPGFVPGWVWLVAAGVGAVVSWSLGRRGARRRPAAPVQRSGKLRELTESGQWAEAETLARGIISTLTMTRGPEHSETLLFRVFAAAAAFEAGRLVEAERELETVLADCVTGLTERDTATISARVAMTGVLTTMGCHAVADRHAELVLQHSDPASTAQQGLACAARQLRAHIRAELGDTGAAEAQLRALIDECTERSGALASFTLRSRCSLAGLLVDSGRAEEAIAILTEIAGHTGSSHSLRMSVHRRLGDAFVEAGRPAEAEREFQAVLAADTTRVRLLGCRFGLARVAAGRGLLEEATRRHEEVLAQYRDLLGEDHRHTLRSRFELADLLARQGRAAESVAAHRAVLYARTRVLGAEHPDTARSRAALAEAERAATD